jgi:hypothetical protein
MRLATRSFAALALLATACVAPPDEPQLDDVDDPAWLSPKTKPTFSDIGAMVHTDAATGKRYLYYKTDGNALRPQQPTLIYGQELRPNGFGFVGKRRAPLRNTLAWEGDVVEAPLGDPPRRAT